jgi:hypothetical protein
MSRERADEVGRLILRFAGFESKQRHQAEPAEQANVFKSGRILSRPQRLDEFLVQVPRALRGRLQTRLHMQVLQKPLSRRSSPSICRRVSVVKPSGVSRCSLAHERSPITGELNCRALDEHRRAAPHARPQLRRSPGHQPLPAPPHPSCHGRRTVVAARPIVDGAARGRREVRVGHGRGAKGTPISPAHPPFCSLSGL